MAQEKHIRRLANKVARELRAGEPGLSCRAARDDLGQLPHAPVIILGLLEQEASWKVRDEWRLKVYVLLFGETLETLRHHIDAGFDWAATLFVIVRRFVRGLAEAGIIDPPLLLSLVHAIRQARLDPGDDVTDLVAAQMAATLDGDVMRDAAELDAQTAQAASEAHDNPFDVMAGIDEMIQSLPRDARAVVMGRWAASSYPVLRDVAVLSLLDPAVEVRRQVCQAIQDIAARQPASPQALRRMLALRSWLPETERPSLDQAIRRLRRHGTDCAAWPTPQVVQVVASTVDGVGAQSVLMATMDGHKHAVSGLLVKQSAGVVDAWSMRGLSQSRTRELVEAGVCGGSAVPVALDFARSLLKHHLAIGLKNGRTPPIGLLDFVETSGIGDCRPAEIDLMELLGSEVDPADLEPAAVQSTLATSGDWPARMAFAGSWFEQDAASEALLRKHRRARRQTKVDLILGRILEPRRSIWAERIAWMALRAKNGAEQQPRWQDFFVLARELQHGRAAAEIPILRRIAERSLSVAARGRTALPPPSGNRAAIAGEGDAMIT